MQGPSHAVLHTGAALGPLLAGLISPTGWNNVFYMLITADILACLVRALGCTDGYGEGPCPAGLGPWKVPKCPKWSKVSAIQGFARNHSASRG